MALNRQNAQSLLSRIASRCYAASDAYHQLDDRTHHLLGILFKICIAAYFIFCALFMTARFVVWPHIENYKNEIEQVASKAIGIPVSIGEIHAGWQGLSPKLILKQLAVHDKSGKSALTLPGVSATLSWWSIPVGSLRFKQLEIDSPDLNVRRDTKGNVYVAGLLFDSVSDEEGDGADWVLSQDEIVINNGKLRWNDEKRKAPELALDDVHIVLQNGRWQHKFLLKARPPATLSAPLEVRADFRHPFFSSNISDMRQWSGVLYADVHNTDLTAWKAYFDYPLEIRQGYGSVRSWLTMDHARVANFTADIALSDVVARLRGDLDPLDLREVSGRISAREDYDPDRESGTATLGAQGHAVTLKNLSLTTRNGIALPETSISEEYTPGRGSAPGKTSIRTEKLDLETVAKFVRFLPMTTEQRKMLADFAPRGELRDFSIQWQGNYPELVSYQASGEFIGLSLKAQAPRAARPASGKQAAQAAIPGIPGFENLTGRVEANQLGGDFSLNSNDLVLHFPGYYRPSAMPFESLKMQASWSFDTRKQQFQFKVGQAEFVQEGIAGSISGKLVRSTRTDDKSSGSIDMQGNLSGFDVRRVGRYLPLQTESGLRTWLTGALEEGYAKEVQFKVKGDLADFPFAETLDGKCKGEFIVNTRLENAKLNYTPGEYGKDGKSPMWPQAEKIQGKLTVNGARMEIWADSAETGNVTLSNVSAIIPDMLTDDKRLEIVGHADGALQDFVRYANASPVADWIGNFTEDSQASGNASLLLKFSLPLARKRDATVQGFLSFDGNDVQLLKGLPVLSGTKGKLEFNENGFSLHDIGVGFLGGAAKISGGTQKSGKFQVKATGNLPVDGVRKFYPGLSDRISGKTTYTLVINEKGHQPDIAVESNLRGIVLNFPAPLKKSASDAMPLAVKLSGLPIKAASGWRDEIRLNLGTALAARYQREKSAEKNAAWKVMRGGIGVNLPAPEPSEGVMMKVTMNAIDVDAWQEVLGGIVGKKRGKAQEASGELGIAAYLDPKTISAKTSKLTVGGLEFDQVDLLAEQGKGSWQIGIKSDQATGVINWIYAAGKQKQDRIAARLTALNISQSATSESGAFLEISTKPSQMPDLDIAADNFVMRGKKLGHLELAASNVHAASGREWNIG